MIKEEMNPRSNKGCHHFYYKIIPNTTNKTGGFTRMAGAKGMWEAHYVVAWSLGYCLCGRVNRWESQIPSLK